MLLDENNNPTGIHIVSEMHTPNPEKERDFFQNTQAEIDVRLPNGQVETVRLSGPSTVMVCIPPDGLAADTDSNGRDEVPSEMTQLDLHGASVAFGPVQVRLNPSRPSLGRIEEQVNNTPGTLDVAPFTSTGFWP